MRTYLRSVLTLGAACGLFLTLPGFAQDTPEKQPEKAQDTVAAKVKFAVVKPADEAVTKALDAKDIDAAKKLIGKEGAFRGTVTKVYTARNNSLIVLDFDEKFRDAMVAKMEPEYYSKFPRMKDLVGKKILVTGKFILYNKTQPEIELTDPKQIKIITDNEASLKDNEGRTHFSIGRSF